MWERASQVAPVAKNPPANARDGEMWFDPWVGQVPWRRVWQYSCLENTMDRGVCGLHSIGLQRVRHK